jgi:hypothetical protein
MKSYPAFMAICEVCNNQIVHRDPNGSIWYNFITCNNCNAHYRYSDKCNEFILDTTFSLPKIPEKKWLGIF